MTLTLELSPELQEKLAQQAQRQGLALDKYALKLLEQHVAPSDRRDELVALLQTWIDEEDADEQRETGDYLIRVLDEDRLSDRPLFPPDLKDITW